MCIRGPVTALIAGAELQVVHLCPSTVFSSGRQTA
jgi:hypothetical protein